MGAGGHIVASTAVYGGSQNLLHFTLPRFGIHTTFVKPGDIDGWRAAIRPETRLLFGETIGNPGLDVLDIPTVSQIAHDAGVPLLVDATFERGDAFFQHRIGRVGESRIHMAGALQIEQRGRLVRALEHERGGQVNGHGARARGGVGRGTGVQGQGVKARVSVTGHVGLRWVVVWCCGQCSGPGVGWATAGVVGGLGYSEGWVLKNA